MIDKLQQRAAAAMAKSSWLFRDLPEGYPGNPAALKALLGAAGDQDNKFGDSAAYREAHAALTDWEGAVALQNKISEAYWSPELRARFGAERVEAAFRDPETAKIEL